MSQQPRGRVRTCFERTNTDYVMAGFIA